MAAFLLVRGAVLHDRTSQPNRSANPPVVIAEQVLTFDAFCGMITL